MEDDWILLDRVWGSDGCGIWIIRIELSKKFFDGGSKEIGLDSKQMERSDQ